MNYFKNVEIAKMYKVSENSVSNWVEASKQKKINLSYIVVGKKSYIENSATNQLLLKELAEKGKKYKNKRSFKILVPNKEFYEIYTQKQIIDIVNCLENYKEIPHKYAYFNDGAKYWDNYVNRVLESEEPITAKRTISALAEDEKYIFNLLKNYKYINVIDIGAGNGSPVIPFLEQLQKTNILRKYIGVDFSPQMLDILELNMKKKFGKDFPIELYVRDITNESIQELVFMNTNISGIEQNEIANIVLFLGSTIENQRKYDQSLDVIKTGMGKNDLFILGQLLDTDAAKIELAFNAEEQVDNSDLEQEMMVLNLLNIKPEFYDVKRYYSESERARIISIRLKLDLNLLIQTESIDKTIKLSSRDEIIIFRHNHHTNVEVIEKLHSTGFKILHVNTTKSYEQLLVISQINTQ